MRDKIVQMFNEEESMNTHIRLCFVSMYECTNSIQSIVILLDLRVQR